MADKKESAAKKFKKLVTEGPEDYRKKYEGKTVDEINAEINEKVERKIHAADERRNAHLGEKMAQYDQRDWHKPIFLRRKIGARHVFWRVFWGLFFIVAAGAISAQIFGWLTFSINIWWVILSVFIGAVIVASAVNLNWFGVFVPAACLVAIANYQTDWLPHTLTGQEIGGIFVVAALLSIAFSILFHRRWHSDCQCRPSHHNFDKNERIIDHPDDGNTRVGVNFGSTIKYVNSDNFKRATLDGHFGSIKVYFDNAKIQGKSATIEINGSFSGFELYVPREWSVVNNLSQNLAGVDEKNPRRAIDLKDEKTVTLVGSLSLSGVEIIYI